MKKQAIKPNNVFSLDKETIANFSSAQMSAMVGGRGEAYDEAITEQSCLKCSCGQGSRNGVVAW